ncbi:MAG: hypothetical protein HEEMFOPI_01216 [Holosporales bacterium]
MKKIPIILIIASFVFADIGDVVMPLKPYNWGEKMHIPIPDNSGDQIFHFKTNNKYYKENPESVDFVEKNLKKAKKFKTDTQILEFAVSQTKIKGFFIEMGVATGRTINFIAALKPKEIIHGFDSFEGLPQDWDRKDRAYNQSVFAYKSPYPDVPVLKNVLLYKGWFRDILPRFKRDILKENHIAFLHIDCDIYESTKDVFDTLGENIVKGTIIIFDEFYNYDSYEKNEYKAFIEFIQRTGKKFRYIAFNEDHEQVVVEII